MERWLSAGKPVVEEERKPAAWRLPVRELRGAWTKDARIKELEEEVAS